MGFFRFQPNFGHAVNHSQCSKICPNLPKICPNLPKIYLKTICSRDFGLFPQKKTSVFRKSIKAYIRCLDFQYKNFPYAFFKCQKTAFVSEFHHTPLWKMTFFSNFHTSCGYEILLTCTVPN
jgi:hypothetical protein